MHVVRIIAFFLALVFVVPHSAYAASHREKFQSAVETVFALAMNESVDAQTHKKLLAVFSNELSEMTRTFSDEQLGIAARLLEEMTVANNIESIAFYEFSTDGSHTITLNGKYKGSPLALAAIAHEFRHYIDLKGQVLSKVVMLAIGHITVLESRAFKQEAQFMDRLLAAMSPAEIMELIKSMIELTPEESRWLASFLSRPRKAIDLSDLGETIFLRRPLPNVDNPILFKQIMTKMAASRNDATKQFMTAWLFSRGMNMSILLSTSYAGKILMESSCRLALLGVTIYEVIQHFVQ